MKRMLFLAILVFAGFQDASAQASGFGLGVIVGEPTGISAKKWLNQETALDFAAAWSFEGENSFSLHADYLFHNFWVFKVEERRLPVYIGVGGRLKFRDRKDDKLGARFPLGINYHLRNLPVDFFLEVVPILELIPSTDFVLNAAIGARYFF